MKTNKLKIFGVLIVLLTILLMLNLNNFIFFSNNVEEINSENKNELYKNQKDTIGFSKLKINDILYDISSLKIREDNKIEFIVKWKNIESSKDTIHIFKNYDVEIFKDIPLINSSLIYASVSFNKESIRDFILEMQSKPEIIYIEPRLYDQLDFVPNDNYYASEQWDLPLIGMESAWDYQLGSQEVLVAVIDTGIDYNHPDLSDNYLPLGYDWVNDDNDPMDDRDHGTHCAGTIAASINNGTGIAGMADVSIFAEKSFNASAQSTHELFASAVVHATDQGAHIISYSAGGEDSQTKRDAVDYALNHGVIFVASAGNDYSNTPKYPAAYPEVIAVAATDQNDQRAWFSNYGDWIDIAAPGVNIFSTLPDNSYGDKQGTSMATPHVSGLAALIKSEYPSYNSSQIENLIYDNAVDLGDPGFDEYYGYGRINATKIFTNDAPNVSSSPFPADQAIKVVTNPLLSVNVSDPNRDVLNVSFYNASDDNLIGMDTGIISGGTASVPWVGLSEGTLYSWYVVIDDGLINTTSSTWSFTTNYAPYVLGTPYPADQAIGIITSPLLSVNVSDLEGDLIDVSFYNASDNSMIGIDTDVASGSIASVLWVSLSEGTIHSWYVVIDDGLNTTTSSTWSFTAEFTIPIWDELPIDQNIIYGNEFQYDLHASDVSGVDFWINDTYNFNISQNGVIINSTTLEIGVYWIELGAYDPYGYYCNATIKITVVENTSPPNIDGGGTSGGGSGSDKESNQESFIPGYHLILIIAAIFTISLILVKKNIKKKFLFSTK